MFRKARLELEVSGVPALMGYTGEPPGAHGTPVDLSSLWRPERSSEPWVPMGLRRPMGYHGGPP